MAVSETKSSPPAFKFDKEKCLKHLESLREEALKRVGHVGHNPFFFIRDVVETNIKMLNDEKCEKTEAFQNSILAIKCETKV